MSAISDEKMTHIVHLILDGLEKDGYAAFPDKQATLREAKKVCFKFLSKLNQVEERVVYRIESQKNAPPQHSPQWQTLYEKYYAEEMDKVGV